MNKDWVFLFHVFAWVLAVHTESSNLTLDEEEQDDLEADIDLLNETCMEVWECADLGSLGPPPNILLLPPPPLPDFLRGLREEGDDCDLCEWSGTNISYIVVDVAESPTEWRWVSTVIVVGLLSAMLGATVMIMLVKCRRLRVLSISDVCPLSYLLNGKSSSVSSKVYQPSSRRSVVEPDGSDGVVYAELNCGSLSSSSHIYCEIADPPATYENAAYIRTEGDVVPYSSVYSPYLRALDGGKQRRGDARDVALTLDPRSPPLVDLGSCDGRTRSSDNMRRNYAHNHLYATGECSTIVL